MLACLLSWAVLAGAYAFLTACGGPMEEPVVQLNPYARMRYEITVTVVGAPGDFSSIDGVVDYRVDDHRTVPIAPFNGAPRHPNKSVQLDLMPVDEHTYRGFIYIDRLLDEDYFGKGVCHWVLQAASIRLRGRTVTFASSIFRDAIVASGIDVRYYPTSAYFDSTMERKEIGYDSRSAPDIVGGRFLVEIKSKESFR